ncbi:putative cyclase-associated protein CAP/septum formation inhibitor MinC [Helianthus annuus]|nr:putative cyclase-associated protein CAP/septum formation inhibitor MinC [Helianthus annuus]
MGVVFTVSGKFMIIKTYDIACNNILSPTVRTLQQDVVAAFEIVNCSSIEVQCQGAAPTISIDNTAGCQLYLSKDSLGSSITTSKASEVNVMVPSEDPNADLVCFLFFFLGSCY